MHNRAARLSALLLLLAGSACSGAHKADEAKPAATPSAVAPAKHAYALPADAETAARTCGLAIVNTGDLTNLDMALDSIYFAWLISKAQGHPDAGFADPPARLNAKGEVTLAAAAEVVRAACYARYPHADPARPAELPRELAERGLMCILSSALTDSASRGMPAEAPADDKARVKRAKALGERLMNDPAIDRAFEMKYGGVPVPVYMGRAARASLDVGSLRSIEAACEQAMLK